MKKHLLSTLVILIALLSACSPRAATLPVPTTIGVATSAPNTPVVEFPTPTQAPVVDAPAATPENDTESLATKIDTTIVPEEECINLEQKLPEDLALSGVWVINPGNPYLENLVDHKDYPVTLMGGGGLDTYNGELAISPNATLMAYIDKTFDPVYHREDKRMLRVLRSSGQALDMSFWKEEWQWIIGWVDDQNLAVATSVSEVVVLNPFTQSMRTFVQPVWVWAKIEENKKDSYSWNIPSYSYSPNLEWFLDSTGRYGNSLGIRNVRTGESTLHFDDVETTSWSADGSALAVVSSSSIQILKNGKQESSFNINGFGLSYYGQPKFSPDNQKLAFNSSKNNTQQLTVLDIAKNKLARLCNDGYKTWYSDASWSPDSRYVVEEVHDASYQSYDLLVDTQEMRAYLLNSGDYQHRFAWLAVPVAAP